MANTYEAIATVTVGSGGTSSISFSSIPQTFTDLCILLSLKNPSTTSNENGQDMSFRLNGDTGSNYYSKILYRTVTQGSASDTGTSMTWVGQSNNNASTMTNTFSNIYVYIPNYTSSNAKSLSVDSVAEANANTYGFIMTAGLWNNTAAITSMSWTPNGGTFSQYSTATLYGIKKS